MKADPNQRVSAPSKVAMHDDSHVISKLKPKVRVIHIFAPRIIKTDVENFRELVQRLTGKQHADQVTKSGRIRAAAKPSKTADGQDRTANSYLQVEDHKGSTKEDGEVRWEGDTNPDSGLDGFGDADSLIQDLTEFPLLASYF